MKNSWHEDYTDKLQIAKPDPWLDNMWQDGRRDERLAPEPERPRPPLRQVLIWTLWIATGSALVVAVAEFVRAIAS